MTELQALIFDVDGTLADTERDGHRVAFNRAFEDAGLDWIWSEHFYGELLAIAGGKERILHYINHYQPDFKVSNSLEEFATNLHRKKNEYYQQLLVEGAIPLRTGVKRLIQEAKNQEIRLAIATTSALPNVLALLEKYLDPSIFELIAAGDIVPAKKPAPDIYFYVLENLNLNPQNCLVFEDSHHGLLAAHQAGLSTIVTVNGYTKNQDFTNALLVLNHLGEPDHPLTALGGNLDLKDHYIHLSLLQDIHKNIQKFN